MHPFWRRDIFEPVDQLHTATNAEIARRHNVEAAEIKDQEDVDGPCANAGNGSQGFDNIIVRQ